MNDNTWVMMILTILSAGTSYKKEYINYMVEYKKYGDDE